MELRTVDPKSLKASPANPRRVGAGEYADAQLVANIQAVGILQPPVVRETGGGLEIIAGHRRVAAAVKIGLPDILVLVREADEQADAVLALSENVVRADMGPVDQWRSIEALISADWTEEAIATALALPVRTLRKLRLLAQILPAMLDRMALGDMPNEQMLRTIAAASLDEQTAVWKKNKPRKGQDVEWYQIANALRRNTLPAKIAQFGDDLARAYGIVWTDDLFAPGDEDARTTTQVEEFMGAQAEWLANNLPPNGHIAELDQYGRPKLPRRATETYGKPRIGDHVACYVDPRSGEVRQTAYRIPEAVLVAAGDGGGVLGAGGAVAVPQSRPDLTQKGQKMIGDIRTDALHQALLVEPIDDDTLIGLLVIALAGDNVQVRSGGGGRGSPRCAAVKLTEGGVLARDPALLRAAARDALTDVLSCRVDMSQSGMVARYAGMAIGADAYLPGMATDDFLGCLSKPAMERLAKDNGVLPRNTGKETRAAMVARYGQETFIYPAARFAPTPEEMAADRSTMRHDRFDETDAADADMEASLGLEEMVE